MLRVVSLFLIVLFLSSSFAQVSRANAALRVLENETRLILSEKLATAQLALENPSSEFSARVKLEIVAPNDAVQAVQEISRKIGRGRQTVSVPIDTSNVVLDSDALLWYRLRYEIAPDNSPGARAVGIVSFSQILPEVFELKTVTSYPVGEELFRVRVQAVNPANQNPVADVQLKGEIKIEALDETVRTEAKTGAEGFAFLEFKLPDFEMNAEVNLKVVGKKNNLTRETEDDFRGVGGKRAEIVTDKPIYQPNQTVNLRLYSYNPNLLPVKAGELTVEIRNQPADKVVFNEKLKTSRFGIASAAWKIPDGAPLGNYQIHVKNAANEEIASERIKITRYDLPNFYTEAKPDRAFYLPDQKTARIEIGGKYLFGKPLTDAKVRIVAQNADDAEIFREITGALNDEGKFSAEIDLSEALKNFKPSSYELFRDVHFSAYVTDATTNRTEPKSFDLRITREPIHVYLIGDMNQQSSRQPLRFYVSTFYADGTPAVCDVAIHELIEKDADGKWIEPELGKSLAKIKTNSYGAAKLKLPVELPENEDEVSLKIIATDKQGLTGTVEKEIDTDDRAALQIETGKIVYAKGEPVKISITSSEQKGTVLVDAVKGLGILAATEVRLEGGRAELVLPYREEFKNVVQIAAYFEPTEADDDEIETTATKTVIYPTPTNLEIKARTSKDVYRPGEQVAVKFRSRNAAKSLTETALGILVVDKAVEERARTESETSRDNEFLNRTFTSRMAGFFGQVLVFGDMTERDVKNLNPAKPLAPDLELAIEIAIQRNGYRAQISRSRTFGADLDKIFTPLFKAKMKPVAETLDKLYDERIVFPSDEKSLRALLLTKNINFADLKDAWGNEFRTEFRIDRDYLRLIIWSLGADKLPDTGDDLIVLESSRKYFTAIGKAIDKAMSDYTRRTRGFIVDYQTLRSEMLKQNIALDALRDAWGKPYRFEFTVDRTNYLLTVKSLGADGKADNLLLPYNRDDFTLWTNRTDYFTVTKANLIKGFNEYVEKNKTFPRTEAEMRNILLASGFNLDELKDALGRPLYIQQKETARLGNVFTYKSPNLKVVKQKVLTFAVRSTGQDGIRGNYDDFELANFSGATSEEEIDVSQGISSTRKVIREKNATLTDGAIGGTVYDPNGAVVPNAEIRVTNAPQTVVRSVRSNDEGVFIIGNLPKDVYAIQISSPGFKSLIITNLTVEPGILLSIDAILEVGEFNSVVDVSSEPVTLNATETRSQTNLTRYESYPVKSPSRQPTFTPRVRDYFAETLLWLPELVTDKKGAAEVRFKMADSLTTWKLYAVGSDENGDFGVVEKELQTFQPFFAELEPPRVLTEGDRIDLPVPIRNYTDKRRKVAVSLTENDWSRVTGGAAQNIEIPANATANAVFNFQAVAPVTDGRQRVTAIARKDSDAIEKAVTVRPNGRETVETKANLFENETAFDVNFPANAFPNTRRAEIKIYPNMLAHVAESVDGLLERPHGCGEQTTSSTYPNLLILKIERELGKEIEPPVKAKAQQFLEEGYKRLLNYQTDSGGFSYWGKSDVADAALTAYVLRFLSDAEDFIEVDGTVVERAENWLLSRQKADGSWESKRGNAEVSTGFIARALSLTAGTDARKRKALTAAIEFLQKRFAETSDAYVLANLALVAQAVGDTETARKAADKLEKLSQPDKESLFWSTTNTPFYGWGTPANLETTALVVQALLKLKGGGQAAMDNEQISRGLAFLMKNKDRFGVWHSTQTTVNVLDALILLQEVRRDGEKNSQEKTEIFINGKKVQEFSGSGGSLKKPFIFDASPFLSGDTNRVEIKATGELNLTMAQIVLRHYINWNETREDSRYFDLKVDFDRLQAKIGDEIVCRVRAAKKINRYGMMLAEIGLPPGADVDRASLEKARSSGSFSSYDILPDRVVVYSWASDFPLEFSFKFRPRFGLSAQTAPSIVYDYYNDEARATLAPQRFEVK